MADRDEYLIYGETLRKIGAEVRRLAATDVPMDAIELYETLRTLTAGDSGGSDRPAPPLLEVRVSDRLPNEVRVPLSISIVSSATFTANTAVANIVLLAESFCVEEVE